MPRQRIPILQNEFLLHIDFLLDGDDLAVLKNNACLVTGDAHGGCTRHASILNFELVVG